MEMFMQTIELFCGTKSFSKVAASRGYTTLTVDVDCAHQPDLVGDILTLSPAHLPRAPLVMWASPPCQTFSVLSIPYYWNADGTPRSLTGHRLVGKTLALIIDLKPKWWFIENPRGMLRKVSWFNKAIGDLGGVRKTITYCQYGDTRQKPTDIWTNARWWRSRRPCAPGDPCHDRASGRGALRCHAGTVALGGARERSRIPSGVFSEILSQLEEQTD